MKLRLWRIGIVLVMLVVTAGCQSTPATVAPTATEVVTIADVVHPVPENQCQELLSLASLAVKVPARAATAPFEDWITGQKGDGCLVAMQGNGTQFVNLADTDKALRTALEGQGWTEDIQYAAGGPTGSLSGYRKEGALLLLSVEWAPSDAGLCSNDKPISECSLTAEQQIYTVELRAAVIPAQ